MVPSTKLPGPLASLAAMGVPVISAGLALGLSGCDDTAILQKLPEPAIQIDELKQRPAALVDILWVVDNSGSMVEEQQALADNFNRFITGLTICQGTGQANDLCDFNTKKCSVSGSPCNPPDYHVGVVATDVRSQLDSGRLREVGLCVPAPGATPSNGKARYCQGSNQDCAVSASDPDSDPANHVCDMGQSIRFITPNTPGAVNAFARAVKVGTGGSGQEEGIRAAAQALGRDVDRNAAVKQWLSPPSENGGFLRTDASLFVIFVSDEDDHSFGQPTYFYRAFESLKGAGNEGLVSMSAITGDPDLDGDGPGPGGCPAMDPTASPGTRYIALSMYSRGLSSEFRVCDGQRLTCPSTATCQTPIKDLPGVCVSSAACETDQDCGNFRCGSTGCVRCESKQCTIQSHPDLFLQLLERNGIWGSICAPDYGVVLGSLGFEAAGLRRKFEMTKPADCTQKVPCCADGTADADCTTQVAVCVKVNGQPIANDRTSGWVYEASSNAVFFDGSFVPPTDAPVTISYRRAAASVPLSCTQALK